MGGLPAKLVVLTIDADPPCAMNEFWLYGADLALSEHRRQHPAALGHRGRQSALGASTPDQAGPNPEVEQQIQQIVDSIQFE